MKSIAVLLAATLIPVGVAQAQAPANCPTASPIAPGTAPRDADALLRLGDLYYKGGAVAQDYAKAFAYYDLAMKAGSASAKAQVGEMTVRGIGTPQDVQRGRDILKEAAASGSASAQLTLGDLAASGKAGFMDPGLAISSYSAAAKAGNSWAMIKLGDIYRYGRFSSPKPRQALDYYKAAADAGNAYGQLQLGSLYLEGQGGKRSARRNQLASASAGRDLLASASAAGIEDADVQIANTYFTGRGNPRSAKKAVAYLQQAAGKGNKAAALALVAAYRDGKIERNRLVFAPNPKLAGQTLETYKSLLTPDELAEQSYLLKMATARPSGFGALYEELGAFPVDSRQSLVRQSRDTNRQFYFFAAQKKLTELGLYTASRRRKSSSGVLKAMASYCRRVATKSFCQQDPASGYYGEILSYAFRDPAVKAEDCPAAPAPASG